MNNSNKEYKNHYNKIILFDGVCNLCNGFIDFVIKRDIKKQIYYASLQSEFSENLLKEHNIKYTTNTFSTIYYFEDGILYNRSTAILKVLGNLDNYQFASKISMLIPAFIRDFLYKFIAKNRYLFFGKKETCRLPSASERSQFL